MTGSIRKKGNPKKKKKKKKERKNGRMDRR
jgi:hypothetical protein